VRDPLDEWESMLRLAGGSRYRLMIDMTQIQERTNSVPQVAPSEDVPSQIAQTQLKTRYGEFQLLGFRFGPRHNNQEIMALVKGDCWSAQWRESLPYVRVHSKCTTSEVFGSLQCDCADQMALAEQIIEEHQGIIIYLDQEARGNGLFAKVEIYKYMEQHKVSAHKAWEELNAPDKRDYSTAAAILHLLDIRAFRLLTNNPEKYLALSALGFETIQREPLEVPATPYDREYLLDKQRHGHLLHVF